MDGFAFAGKDGSTYTCAYQAQGEVSMQVDELNAVTDLMLDDGTRMQTVVITKSSRLLRIRKWQNSMPDLRRWMEIITGA